jgi:4-hydroxybutyrate dehydrogenase
MSFPTWSFPTSIVFGAGSIQTLADRVSEFGATRVLLVADKGVVAAGLARRVATHLSVGGITARIFDAVDPNPVEKNVFDGVAAYKAHEATLIVSLGGGAAMDVGKLIALMTTHDRPMADYDDAIGGDVHITSNIPPVIAVPTTAGTGSEVGRSGVVILAATGRKTVIFSPHLLAKVAILDPDLTRTMPAHVSAATGFDAFTHCLEAYCALGDHPMADALALGGMELAVEHLERAVSHPNDLTARGAMMKVAMMGALAFQKGLGVCHSLAHPLSSEKGLHHGLANALCLPVTVAFNESVVAERLDRCRKMLDPNARDIATALRNLRDRVGIRGGLTHRGVTRADIPKLSKMAFEDACHRSNPRPVTESDLAYLYSQALEY